MTYFYSASTGGFYHSGIHTTMPDDAVAISEAQHTALLDAQASGKIIAANDNGEPIAIDRPAPDAAELLTIMRRKRNTLLTACDWTQMPDAPLSDAERTAWIAYRQALRDLPETFAENPQEVIWPEQPGASGEQH